MGDIENVIIVGSGPAGYTAALYTSRANLAPLVIEGFLWGGLLQQTTEVENYPGFRDGIQGPELMQTMRDQAERFGARFITDLATRVELAREPGGVHRVWVGDAEHRARTVILAMGAEHKKLGVPGEEELGGVGVSYCATCDAAFFADRETIIVGGGDSAMEEANYLTKFASRVTVVHRRRELRASKIMQDRALANPKIHFEWNSEVVDILGSREAGVRAVVLKDTENGEVREFPTRGVFYAIGHVPNTQLFRDKLAMNESGYLVVEEPTTRTAIEGGFAAGDVMDPSYRQAITSAGSGCKAAIDAERWLAEHEGH